MKKKKFLDKENVKVLFTILNIIIYLVLFLVTLVNYYEFVNYYFYGYAIIGAIYLAIFIIFGKIFDIFVLGETRVNDLLISYSLTLFITNFLIYFITCLISFRMTPVLPLLILQLVDMALSAILLFIENKILRDKFPVPRAIAIFGEPNYEILDKIYKYRDILVTVERKIDTKDIDFSKLDDLLNGYERVITVDVNHDQKKLIFKTCYENFVKVLDIPSISDMLIASSDIMHVIDTPILKINKFGPSTLESMIKRLIDIIGSILLIVLTSPIMLITIIAIKLQDHGDVLFKQDRLTKNGKIFKILKFRSMIMDAEKDTGAVLATKDDERITKVGRFIRKTRFDELPQLFNIIKGDMTFVGPRPERPEMYDEILKDIPEFKYRLVVKAGLTGYAQIYGKYNTATRDKLLLDIYYIENYKLSDDIKLLIQTIKMVFKPEATEGVNK